MQWTQPMPVMPATQATHRIARMPAMLGRNRPIGLHRELTVETPLPDDAAVQDITLKLDCWDAETGIPADGAYTDQYNNYEWQEFTELAMEEVDADGVGGA